MTKLHHGGALDALVSKYGGKREDWLDLSTGINPRSIAIPEIDRRCFAGLPQARDLALVNDAARKAYGVENGMEVVAVAGTQWAVEILPRMLAGNSAAILSGQFGTYGEHAHCCAKAGRTVRQYREPDDIGADDALAVLVHPNNPDGRLWERRSIHRLALRLGEAGGHLIVDEAFCDSVPTASFVRGQPSNMIILRSFGKFFGLAGIRLGFVVCARHIAERIREWLGPWPVSGPALAIAARAFPDKGWIENTRDWQRRQSAKLTHLLERCGLDVVGRHPLFALARHERAGEIVIGLARRHVAVRDFADRPQLLRFGLPENDETLARVNLALVESLEPVAT